MKGRWFFAFSDRAASSKSSFICLQSIHTLIPSLSVVEFFVVVVVVVVFPKDSLLTGVVRPLFILKWIYDRSVSVHVVGSFHVVINTLITTFTNFVLHN